MATVYITNASLNLISRSVQKKVKKLNRMEMIESIMEGFSDVVGITKDDLHKIFENDDLKSIYFTHLILKDFGILMNELDDNKMFVSKYIEEQNKHFAYEVKVPAYHKNKECQWMKKNFTNIQIPEKCITDKIMHTEAKKWISANKALAFHELNNQFKTRFNCLEGLILVEKENSGTSDFENGIIDTTLDIKLKMKKEQLRFCFDEDEPYSKDIEKYRFTPAKKIKVILDNNNYTLEKKEAILNFHQLKKEFYIFIIESFKKRYNFDLSFESTILDSIGFHACRGDDCRD